jgi:hypothetical protein
LIAIPVSLGFDLLSSFSFSILLLTNIISGAYLYILVSKKVEFFQIELFGIGIGLGTLFPAVLNYCARLIRVPIESTALMFPLLMILVFVLRRYQKRHVQQGILPSKTCDFVLILSTPIFALAAWTESLATFCIYLVVALILLMFSESSNLNTERSNSYTKYLSLLIIPLGSILSRFVCEFDNSVPIWRQLVGVDVAFDEATAFGTAKYGPFDNALLAGQLNEGHVLTHSWAGDFASFLDLPPFMISASLGLGVGVLGVAAMLYSTSITLFGSAIAARLALVFSFLQASMPEEYLFLDTMRMAHSMSIMWMMLFCFLAIDIYSRTLWNPQFWIFFLIFGVTFSKVHWGLLAVSIVVFLYMFNPKQTKNLRLAVIAIPSFLAFTYLSFPDGKGFPVNIDYSPGFILEVLGVLTLRLLFSVGVVRSESNAYARKIGAIVVLFAAIAHTVLAGEYASNYWISFALLWAAVFSGKLLDDALSTQHSFVLHRYFTYLLSLAFAIFSCYYFFADNYYLILIDSSSLRSWFIVSNPELIPFVVVISASGVGILFLTLTSSGFRSTGFVKNLLSVVVTTIFFVNIGFWMVQNQKINILESHYDIQLTSDLIISDTQMDIGRWLESNTDADSILATNFLCDVTVGLEEPFPSFKNDDCLDRNTLTWLAAIGHRRVLIESPVYSGSYIGTNKQIRDYNSSIRFGRDMNSISGGYLASRGVDYFIFDKGISEIYGLRDFGNVLFQNFDYAVIALDNLFE